MSHVGLYYLRMTQESQLDFLKNLYQKEEEEKTLKKVSGRLLSLTKTLRRMYENVYRISGKDEDERLASDAKEAEIYISFIGGISNDDGLFVREYDSTIEWLSSKILIERQFIKDCIKEMVISCDLDGASNRALSKIVTGKQIGRRHLIFRL